MGSDGASSGETKRFLVGELVEVRQKVKGLRGSWHPAVIVEVLKGKRKVEYEELLDKDGVTKLQETVPVGKVSDGDKLMATLPLRGPVRRTRPVLRPRPPAVPNTSALNWTEGLWVDCFYEDAWWEGVLAESVTSLVCEDVASLTAKPSVKVLFPEENDVSIMPVKDMRVGQEWDEATGHWNPRGCEPVPFRRQTKRARAGDKAQDDSKGHSIGTPSKVLASDETPPTSSNLLDESTINSIITNIQSNHQDTELDVDTPLSAEATVPDRRAKKLFPLGGKGKAASTDEEEKDVARSGDAGSPRTLSGDDVRRGEDTTPIRGVSKEDTGPRDVNITSNLSHKRTVVDNRLGNSILGWSSYQKRPFGMMSNFVESEDLYTLQVDTLGFSREQMRVVYENGDLIIKAAYRVDKEVDKLCVKYSGVFNSRVAVPKDVENQLISVELKEDMLIVTLPKCQVVGKEAMEIQIK